MKKFFSKFINVLLIISLVVVPNSAFALTETQVKAGASKGDIYNPQTNTIGNSATINDNTYGSGTYSAGDVEVQKIVRKTTTLGKYEVEFKIRGKEVTQGIEVVNPVYVVVVLDASNSMDNPNITKWNNAVQGAKDFADAVLAKVPSANLALVKFAGKTGFTNWSDAEVKRYFENKDFDNTNIGGLKVNGGGATNLGEGLRYAYNLLDDKSIPDNAVKYVVVLSDGVPTLYTNSNGVSVTTSESDYATHYDTASHNYATTWANKIKSSSDLNATLISIGYELDAIVDSSDRKKAPSVLRGIASGNNFYIDSSMGDIVSKFKNLTSKIETTYYAGTDVKLTDNLGNKFTLASGNTTLTLKKITKSWQSLGNFYINIDQKVDTGWYETNDGFSLIYTDYKGKTKTITSDKNPEVYWVNKYNYTVNYYKDAITNTSDKTHFINGYTDKADNGEVILKNDIDLNKYIPEGYYLDGMYNEKGPSKIDSLKVDKTKTNVINVLYKIKKFNYLVNYYYADLNNNYDYNNPDSTKTVKDVSYGTKVTTSNHYLDDKDIKLGYSLDKVKTKNITYTIKDDKVVIDIYYKRNSYGYTVNYYFNKNLDSNLTNNSSGILENKVYASNNYLEDVNIEGLLNKNLLDNTNYFLEPDNLNNTSNITIGIDPLLNVLNLYYVDTHFVSENIAKDADVEVVTSSNTPITYTVNYDSVINNIRKNDVVTVTIIDKLPFSIDESNLMTNLNGGIYNEDNLTITWTFTEKTEDFTKVYPVSKSIDYTVVYKDYADISSSDNNTLINTVIGVTTVGDIKTAGVTTTYNVDVEIEGKVIVHYVTRNGKKLTDDIVMEEYVGTDYKTNKKEFDKYSFIKLIGAAEGKFIEGITEITYIYDLTPLPPKTGMKENNSFLYVKYILTSISLIAVEEIFRRRILMNKENKK